ncbi:cation:proton antiporter [Pseudodesulfovibrio sp. zrk46]|uniref:cation:proton antiporter n=1 Tax=Pseudodesulfovibrio sp. zrk46 TaxID=2725288 RepID=UPI001FFCD5A4|nr:cation:proton antiporter [Pseudodesulfovibrio sp. zrk46]
MIGQLLSGMLLGPPVLGLIEPSHALEIFAEIGIFLVMFHTGMELDIRDMLSNAGTSIAVAISGFILPFALGVVICQLFGSTIYQSLFVGLGLSITAIAVQSVILHDMGLANSHMGHIIIGAAIVDDILSLMGLSVLLGITQTGTFEFVPILIVLLKVIIFFVGTFYVGNWLVPKIRLKFHKMEAQAFTLAMLMALFMALLAELAGLHMVIGAFLAGQLMQHETYYDEAVHNAIFDRFYGLSYGSLVPIFFATLSFHIHFVPSMNFVIFTIVLIATAVVGKLFGCGIAARPFGRSRWESIIIGFGMNGRGAVELVVAAVVIGHSNKLIKAGIISSPLLTDTQFSALVLMAFVTTLMAPFGLKWAIHMGCRRDEHLQICRRKELKQRKKNKS